jgi:glutamate synthase (NADPH/NADH) large chain
MGVRELTTTASALGLFDPALEKDSCGVGFIADIKGRKSHKIIQDALTILLNLEHRGAVGADPRAGDGAGILLQTPHKFFAKQAAALGFALPPPGHYAVGALFLPHDAAWRSEIMDTYAAVAAREGMRILGWRDVPTNNATLGASVKPTEPVHKHVFIARSPQLTSEDEFERRLYILRKTISGILYGRRERRVSNYYPVSISCRTVIYKGMFLADQLGTYYPDLNDPDFESALALVHQRFSQHLPDLVAGASLPHDRAQRRDQHAARQQQLDGGAAGFGVLAAARRRHQQGLADLV